MKNQPRSHSSVTQSAGASQMAGSRRRSNQDTPRAKAPW